MTLEEKIYNAAIDFGNNADISFEQLAKNCVSICQEAVDEQMNEAKAILIFAKRKLELYHEAGGGKYLGGLEYSELIKRIDKIINPSPSPKESEL